MGDYTDIELKVRLSPETPEHIVTFLDEYINRFDGEFAQSFWNIEDSDPTDPAFLEFFNYCAEHDPAGRVFLLTVRSCSVIHGSAPIGGNSIFSQDEAYSTFKRGEAGQPHELAFLSDLYDYYDHISDDTPVSAFLGWIERWVIDEPETVVGLLQEEGFFGTRLRDIIVHKEKRFYCGKDKNKVDSSDFTGW